MSKLQRELLPASAKDVADALATATLFSGVGVEAVGVFLEQCDVWPVPKGTLFISPTTNDKTLYIILQGSASVRLEDRNDATLTELVQGQCVGEMSIIEDAPPSAFVTAVSDCRLFAIGQDVVWSLINGSHGVARNLLQVLSQRLRFDNDHIVNRSELVEQNRRNAITDALTDLHNRYWMQVMFARKIDRAKTTDKALCLAVLDLDRFKAFNDHHGHQKGDLLLQSVASALRDLFRPTDLVARFGGDEFAVLLPDTTIEQAELIGSRVREGIVKRVDGLADNQQNVTVSVGLSAMHAQDTLESLLRRADEALYRAKAQGRNRVST